MELLGKRKNQGGPTMTISTRLARRLSAFVGCTLLTLSALSTYASAEDAKKLKIIFVSPLGPAQPFYLPILKGFDLAGKQLNIETVFRGNQQTSLFSEAPVVKRLLEDAIASKPDGLVVSDIYPDVLNEDIIGAVKSGIPVVLTNNGFGQAENVGALAFVGTDEHALGEIGATRLRELGAKNVLVIRRTRALMRSFLLAAVAGRRWSRRANSSAIRPRACTSPPSISAPRSSTP
jgi:ABC-type sugar transport system substrate-binding protein